MKKIVFFLTLIISFKTIAQGGSQIDSIRQRIIGSQSDSLKAIEYLEIANRHKQKDSVFKNLSLSLDFARKAKIPKYISNSRVNLSNWYNNYVSRQASVNEHLGAIAELEKFDFKSGIANHYIRLGYRYNSTNQDSANLFINKGVVLAKQAKDDNVILTGLLALGNRAFYNLDFEKALALYIEGEEICRKNEKLTNSIKHASFLEYIGYVMQRTKQHQKAIYYFKESMKIYEKNANAKHIANMQTNIAEEYFEKKEYEKVIPFLNKTIQYNNTYNVQKNVNLGAYLKRAYCYGKIGKTEQAEKDYLKAISLAKLDQNSHHLTNAYISLGDFYRQEKKYALSEENYLLAETEAKKRKDTESLEKIYKGLANIKGAEKEFETALSYAAKASQESEKQSELSLNEKIVSLEKKYESEKKEQEIALLTTKHQVAEKQKYIYIVISLLLLATGFFLFFGYKNKIRTAQKLEELNTLKSRFFANISHEFRTPLTLIKSPVQQLQKDATTEQEKQLQLIDRNANRMLELVDQLLALSKIDSGQLQLILKEGNLNDFLHSIADPFIYLAQESNKKLELDFDIPNENYPFDKDILEKITTNLLHNAIKYSDEASIVNGKLSVDNQTLKVSIRNYNSSLTKTDLQKLFERFYQKNTNQTGAGIGLALVKELITLYEGTIHTNLENGILTITYEIPLHTNLKNAVVSYTNTNETVSDASFSSDTNEYSDELPILLITDDNASIRNVLKDIFKEEFKIYEAENGEEALKIAEKEIPDCIISDIMMPKIDGLEFTKQIKTNELTSFIPVILLTAKTTPETKLEAIKNQADGYLTKPFQHDLLKELVYQQINERKKLQKRYSQELILKPTEIVIDSVDEKFITRIEEVIHAEITNQDFNTEAFAEKMHVSRMQLHRKLKSLFGVTTTEFIRNERLKIAVELLKNEKLSISEIAYSVGFNDVYYFSKCFKDLYQKAPSEYYKK